MARINTHRICSQGHRYHKTSDCPVCPRCEELRKPSDRFFASLAAPARRALENAGLTTLKKLAKKTEKEVLSLHGLGKTALPILKSKLEEEGLGFKQEPVANTRREGKAEWFREYCLLFPDSQELPHFEKTSFRYGKKIFATIDKKNNRACIKLSAGNQDVFSQVPGKVIYPVPNKWGQQGWTFAELDRADKRILKQMVELAYREVSEASKSPRKK